MIINRIHYLSGVIICSFTGIHLFNHLYSIFGVDKHITMMNELRLFYRNIYVETVLLWAVTAQIISGISLFIQKKRLANSFYEKLQIWSGLYLAVFFVIHVGAVMVGRVVLQLDTNFYFGAAGINAFPFNLFFIPYYTLAILSFFAHIASIHAQKMKIRILRITPSIQSFIIICIGTVVMMIVFYGLTNKFSGVSIPKEYQILIGK